MKALPLFLALLVFSAAAFAAPSGAVVREDGAIYLEDVLPKPVKLATLADSAL